MKGLTDKQVEFFESAVVELDALDVDRTVDMLATLADQNMEAGDVKPKTIDALIYFFVKTKLYE